VISALSVSVIPHPVHPRKAVDLPERIPPSASGIWGGCMGQVSNPPNSIGTAVQPQVVIKRANGLRITCRERGRPKIHSEVNVMLNLAAGWRASKAKRSGACGVGRAAECETPYRILSSSKS